MCKNDNIIAAFLIFAFGLIVGACVENRYMEPEKVEVEVVKRDTIDKTDYKLVKKLKTNIVNLKEDLERAEKSLLLNGGK